MNNNIKRLMTFTTVIFLSLSPALAPIGSASAENVTPTATAPGAHPSEKGHGHHPGKDGKVRAGGHFIIFETAKLLEMDRTELINSLKAGKTLRDLLLRKRLDGRSIYSEALRIGKPTAGSSHHRRTSDKRRSPKA